ncbi:MAG: FAD-dependent oxidoreductase [bacterium]|nr:FAD-dependent oxidoreductase [bacterium]
MDNLTDKIKLKINGQEIECAPGKTILEVVRENNLDDIPTLCNSVELDPYASCFVCVVEVKGRPILVPSCATRVANGMEVETRNERIIASRKTAFELLISNHYADCVSPCLEGCPAHTDIQGYIALSAMGQYEKAVNLIREYNPLPAICGRVCVRKCELNCRRCDIDAPVGINWIKRFVIDIPGMYDQTPVCDPPTGKTVGIVGAGPAGLTAAWFLARKGHKPILYEANEKAGGMLRYGIPTYRLPDDVLDQEVDFICRVGAEIKYDVKVGKDISVDELMKKHDAVFLATGAWAGKPMKIKGEFDTEGIVTGVDFLPKMAANPEKLTGTVVVVGGGNTAMDVARTAWRLGADKVIILYRRTKDEMPADAMEIRDFLEEGIELIELAAPVGIISENGKIKALRCQRMKLGEPDSSGRRRPVPLEGSEFDLPCQLAVSAIGQDPILEGLTENIKGQTLQLTKWNTIVVDKNSLATNITGLFAGGDAADDGPTVAIDAIADGKQAAAAIDAYLNGKEIPKRPFIVHKDFWSRPEAALSDVKESPRHEIHMMDVEDRRGNFREVAVGFEYEDNIHECDRCLSCGCIRFDDCALRLGAEKYGVDMNKYKGYIRRHKVDDRHPYIIYDPNKCILCARCIRTCARVLPISALGLVGRGFKTEMRPAMNDPLVETSCVACGNCVDTCPTAALTIKYPFPGRACLETEDIHTYCGFCSLACPITVKKFGDNRYFIGPSGVPGEYLCRYGRFGTELFIKKRRITAPILREGNARQTVELPIALIETASGLKRIAHKYGADHVGVFVSPELTNEELYLAGKIAREGLGTNNIASLSVLGTGNRAGALDKSFGFTASTSDRSFIDGADLIICNNTSMESDHLILAVDIIQAVKAGAKMIVSNSTLDKADQLLSTLAMDPMRGRAAILWNGIMQVLLDDGFISQDILKSIPGASEFLAGRDFGLKNVSALSGIDAAEISAAADIIRNAKKIVFIHSTDRTQDHAPGDIETLANFVVLLRAAGIEADLLMPRLISNSAGLEIMGADPAFAAGKTPVPEKLQGARSHEELIKLLNDGEIRSALIIGEDPMAWGNTGTWFRNIEFLAAMDWTSSETTQFADVVLPGSTYLETKGTRCNFEGRVIEFEQAVEPPAEISGREILQRLANEFGIKVKDDITSEISGIVNINMGDLLGFYWNTGQKRKSPSVAGLVSTSTDVKTTSIQLPLTHGEQYKREIREVGTDHYRVQAGLAR